MVRAPNAMNGEIKRSRHRFPFHTQSAMDFNFRSNNQASAPLGGIIQTCSLPLDARVSRALTRNYSNVRSDDEQVYLHFPTIPQQR